METMFILVLGLVFCGAVGVMAQNRGRSFGIWFLISLLISPILSALLLLMIGKAKPIPLTQNPEMPLPSNAQSGSVTARETRECPFCAETILAKAKVCKHCGRDIIPTDSQKIQEKKEISSSPTVE